MFQYFTVLFTVLVLYYAIPNSGPALPRMTKKDRKGEERKKEKKKEFI